MLRFALASIAASASLALLGCVSDDNNAPASPSGEDAGGDGTVGLMSDAGIDATLADGAGPDGAGDAAPSSDSSEASSPDAAPLVCSDAGTGRCLVVLARNQANPVSAALHGGFLYWLEEGLPGRIQRVPVGGGQAEQLVTGQNGSNDLTLDDTSLYWANEYAGTVYSAPLTGVPDGGSPTLLAVVNGGSPFRVTVDAARIYWTDFNAGKIYAAPLGGITDGGGPTVLASGQPNAWDIQNDGVNLYWTTNVQNGAVMALSLADGGPPVALVPSVDQPDELSVSGGTVYYATNTANVIYSIPTTGLSDGGAPSIFVATGSDSTLDASAVTTTSFAYDGTTLFWTTSGNPGGEVRSAPPGGSATTLATGMTSPVSILFDATNIYWTNAAYGAVFEMAK